jgi:hypothetical protein
MTKVKLEPINNGPYIKAPEFCPYKVERENGFSEIEKLVAKDMGVKLWEGIPVVNSTLCPLCKQCSFVSEVNFDLYVDVTQEERQAFITYLTYKNASVASNISRQSLYLGKENRVLLAILLSPETFDEMLVDTIKDEGRRSKILSYYANVEIPLCYIAGCPVYLSRKLTKSDVQVVGEVQWK